MVRVATKRIEGGIGAEVGPKIGGTICHPRNTRHTESRTGGGRTIEKTTTTTGDRIGTGGGTEVAAGKRALGNTMIHDATGTGTRDSPPNRTGTRTTMESGGTDDAA